jgi:ABC-2 type transport system ATP-binding protein
MVAASDAHRSPAAGATGEAPVMEASHLSKTFSLGLRRKKVEAVRDVSFAVLPGEVYGFLGPNGAGKTTTMKMCMGLIRPSGGTVQLFGQPHTHIEVRRHVGFLPEHPYFYDYLRPTEILDFYGRLFGIPKAERRRRSGALLERVGLGHAMDRTLRKFSKGMLQRVGIAQALINEPKLVVLDEPLSGLDPIGRKQIRDLIVDLRAEGKTIFFSSHILSDIEMICDKVAIIDRGVVKSVGSLDELLHPDRLTTEITYRGPAEIGARLRELGAQVALLGEYTQATVAGSVDACIAAIVAAHGSIDSVVPKRESLEDLFMRAAIRGAEGHAPEGGR